MSRFILVVRLFMLLPSCLSFFFFFFFNDTATTEIYTLSLHDALPIYPVGLLPCGGVRGQSPAHCAPFCRTVPDSDDQVVRSEEHTSELQSRLHLVCRLLLEKKKKNINITNI